MDFLDSQACLKVRKAKKIVEIIWAMESKLHEIWQILPFHITIDLEQITMDFLDSQACLKSRKAKKK